jgi:hypothetical protein
MNRQFAEEIQYYQCIYENIFNLINSQHMQIKTLDIFLPE